MVEGGGYSSTSVPRQGHCRGGGLAGGGTDPKRGRVLPCHRHHGGDLEVSCGDSQSPLHRRHHLPRLLHGFRAGCGMGTVTLKVKLLYQVDALRDAVLYAIFLDLHKSYNASDRSMCMGILKGCGMGPRALFPL